MARQFWTRQKQKMCANYASLSQQETIKNEVTHSKSVGDVAQYQSLHEHEGAPAFGPQHCKTYAMVSRPVQSFLKGRHKVQ